MLRNPTWWSRLNSTSQIKPYFINNLSKTNNSVEKHCFVVLNVKLQVKVRFETFFDFWNSHIVLSHGATLPARLVLLKIFTYPIKKRVIYRPELNL